MPAYGRRPSPRTGRLVLAYKGEGKPVTAPSSYHPLCMVNNEAKLLERLILVRLNRAMAVNSSLLDSQYGFRPGRGTIKAIREVLDMVDVAASGATRDRDLYLLVALDVRNRLIPPCGRLSTRRYCGKVCRLILF